MATMCEGGREAAAPPPADSVAEEEAGGGGEATPRQRPRGWRSIAFIIGFYMALSMATNAFTQPITNYLIKRYNMKANAATNVSNVFSGTYNFSPVAGAFIADAFWGRFRTLIFGIVAGLVGMVVVTLSSAIPQLRPPSCSDLAREAGTCPGPSGLHRAVLYIGMALIVVLLGGTNPTALPFGVDQFDAGDEGHQRGLKRFYNWFYVVAMMASFMVLTFVVYIQDKVSWVLGFAIPMGLMLATFAVFLAGTPLYVYVPPEGSIFSSVARVVVASCRKWRLRLPHPDSARQQEALLYNPPAAAGNAGGAIFRLPLTLQFSFLNKAAIVSDAGELLPDGTPARPWSLCSVQQVEELKCLVKIVPVWVSGVMWFIALTELTNYTFIQATTMDLHMGRGGFTVPPVSIAAIFSLAVALFVPVYDVLIAPLAQRLTRTRGAGGITLLQRQGAGIVVGALAFVVAAAVERRRRGSALEHGGRSPMSVFLLAPQLAVMGVAGAVNLVGQMEFYNTQFPEQMRTLGNAAFYCAQGAASYLATTVVDVVNARTRRRGKPGWVSDDITAGRLDYFYYTMAVFGAVNLVYFLVCSYFYRYKGEQAESSHGHARVNDVKSNSTTEKLDSSLLK